MNLDIDKELRILDESLKKELNSIKVIHQKSILDSMEYSLFTGGKRLRPLVALKTFEIFSENIDDILPYCNAIEMIHTYSLIHDDLPSMDNDDYRRGRLTNHKKFGEAMAILAGDALLNLAFEVINKDIVNGKSEKDILRRVRASMEISNYSGLKGMIGGQVVDMFTLEGEMDRDKLIYMYEMKTAALFMAATVVGALIGGANEDEVENLRQFALNLGLAYQIQDDILDLEEDNDINKVTYLKYFSLEEGQKAIDSYTKAAIFSLEKLKGRDVDFLCKLTYSLVNRNK